MGIMNKMKTVWLRDYAWGSNTGRMPSNTFYAAATIPGAKPFGLVHLSDDSLIDPNTYNRGIYMDDRPGIIMMTKKMYNTTAELKADLEDISLTYETVDSVEEKIVSYHAPQLIDWTKYTNSTGKGITYTNKGNGLFSVSGKLNAGEDYATYYFDKGRDGRKIKSKIGHVYACGISRIGSKRDVKNSGVQGVVARQLYFDEYSVYIFEAMSNNSDINFYVNIGSRTEQLNQDFYPYFLDLTELYGAGNEPRNATFLQQHPEYNKFVPFNEGPINITEEII